MSMKEIKDFVDMIERFKDTSLSLRTMIYHKEYQALKAVADKPDKAEVTDEMIKVASKKLHEQLERVIYHNAEALAENTLEAVFDHIGEANEMVGSEEKQGEWIEWNHKSYDCPINPSFFVDQIFDYKKGEGEKESFNRRAGDLCWSNIVRYRIISEPKEENKEARWDDPENFFGISGIHLKPKKQTLLEWVKQKDESFHRCSPEGIIELISEYLEKS